MLDGRQSLGKQDVACKSHHLTQHDQFRIVLWYDVERRIPTTIRVPAVLKMGASHSYEGHSVAHIGRLGGALGQRYYSTSGYYHDGTVSILQTNG